MRRPCIVAGALKRLRSEGLALQFGARWYLAALGDQDSWSRKTAAELELPLPTHRGTPMATALRRPLHPCNLDRTCGKIARESRC